MGGSLAKAARVAACAALLMVVSTKAMVIPFDLNYGATLQGYTVLPSAEAGSLLDAEQGANGAYLGCGTLGAGALLGQLTSLGNLDIANFNSPQGFQVVGLADVSTACASVDLQPGDDKPVIIGTTYDSSGDSHAFVLRFTAAGAIDTSSFASPDGYVLLTPDQPSTIRPISQGKDIAVQPSDSYLLAGGSVILDELGNAQAFVARLSPSGVLDAGYGTSGIAYVSVPDSATLWTLALQSDEKAILGLSIYTDSVAYVAVARLNTDGTLDTTFGTSGSTVITALPGTFTGGLVIETVGTNVDKIVVSAFTSANQVYFVRLDANGALDEDFGSSGILTITQEAAVAWNVMELAVSAVDDSIYAAGQATNDGTGFVIKITADGAMATEFGSGGIQLVPQIVPGDPLAFGSVVVGDDDLPAFGGVSGSDFLSLKMKSDMTPTITLKSPLTAQSPLSTNQMFINGGSSHAQQAVHVLVDSTLARTTVTNSRGDWIAGLTDPLSYAEHTVTAQLIYDASFVLDDDTATVTLQLPA